MRRTRRIERLFLASGIVVIAACGRDAPPSRRGTTDAVPADTATPAAPVADWGAELGSVLVVADDTHSVGLVVSPLTPAGSWPGTAELTLVSASGEATRVDTELMTSENSPCANMPAVQLRGAVPAGWSVGLHAPAARPLPLDSMESMSRTDSARVTTEAARLASALATRSDRGGRFRGLPFAVLGAHRAKIEGREILFSHLARRLPHEAAPIEEHTLLIAERATDRRNAAYTTVYSQRSEGAEDTAEHYEVLAAFRASSTIFVIIARDQLAETTYEVLQRAPNARWRSRWSRRISC